MFNAKLIALTQPTKEFIEETGGENAEDIISYCARVSNPGNQANFETSAKLLNFCMRKKHWSIFQMGHVIMKIECTRDIGRQILRHHSFSFQEFSQRYAAVNTNDFVIREARLQDTKNRQMSVETNDEVLRREWNAYQWEVVRAVKRAYQWALDNNIAKEQARVVLPEGLTPSVMFMGGLLRDWMFFCTVRMREGETQKEHVEVAKCCWDILKKAYPFLEQANIGE
jgi:thymidylate synthase (FAD)